MTAASPLDLHLHLSQVPAPASRPPEYRGLRRDEVRLLVIDKHTGARRHARFYELPDYLAAGDVVVVNTSATIPGRLKARVRGQTLYIHLATKLDAHRYIVERRTAGGGPDRQAFAAHETIDILHPLTEQVVATLVVEQRFHPNSRLWEVTCDRDLFALAARVGAPIRYNYVDGHYDTSMYQTVFAHHPGSAEMPSAGRPFTHDVLRNLTLKGIKVRSLVLHTGVSSHEVETDLSQYPVLPEWYSVPEGTAAAVNQATREGRRVIAVGTTVVRALESAADTDGCVAPTFAWTTHLVTPDTPPKVVTGIVTGLHESQTSHLAMMYAFTRPVYLQKAYQDAVERGYLWHEFGDVSLIL